ncbi:hypothetical protein LTR94_028243, partial [Friedmanniomyces endolithicus]
GSVEALETAIGMSAADLDRALRTYARGRVLMGAFSSEQFQAETVEVTTLGQAESDLLLLNLRLATVRDDEEDQAEYLATVKARTAPHLADPFAQRLLARAEIRMGDRLKGEELAKALAEADPTDTEALLLIAESRIEAAHGEDADYSALMGQARRYLGMAYAQDDLDFRTLYMLSQTRRGMPSFPDDNDKETILLALELAPQIPTIRFAAAQTLAARSEYGQAIALLHPMTSDPHGVGGGSAARTLIEEYSARLTSQKGPGQASNETTASEATPVEEAAPSNE